MLWQRLGLWLGLLCCSWGPIYGSEPAAGSASIDQLQGRWKVVASYGPNGDGKKLPVEARLNSVDTILSLDGNVISEAGHPVLALTTELPLPAEEKNVGLAGNRLVMLTLPNGKGLLCSWHLRDETWEIAYPHTTSCHRGSGQIILLKRMPNDP